MQWIDAFLHAERLPAQYRRLIEQAHTPLAERIATRAAQAGGTMVTIGVCGPQGSGKSTLVASLKKLLEVKGLTVAALSLDDLYLTRAERTTLCRKVHPLFQTRGVPGTHDVTLGLEVFSQLCDAATVLLPSFDKSQDDRRPREQWSSVQGPVNVLLFEGWCVGAKPQSDAALIAPVNALERIEDPDGGWRRYANAALADEYQRLFAHIDMLILLKAESFNEVYHWRLEQERKLRDRIATEGGNLSRLMTEAQIAWFVSHYQRLTTHIIEEMPTRADIILPIVRVAEDV